MAVTVRGAAELAAKCERIAARLERPTDARADLERIFRARIQKRFDSEGEGDWPALKASTVESKARRGDDPRMMRATGALLAALTGYRAEVGSDRIVFGGAVPFYGHIVAAKRPVMPEGDPQLTEDVRDALARHIMGAE